MSTQAQKASLFLTLHRPHEPLLLPNPWDPGSAKILVDLGYMALATTRRGFAGALGRLDGRVTRDEALSHAAAVVDATDVPVSADLENCFAHEPTGVAETVAMAIEAGLAGCSVEDFAPGRDDPIYPLDISRDRVAAAAETAHAGDVRLVVTARAENYLHGRPDLADTIARLQTYQDAGADVLYAPGLSDAGDIQRVVTSVDRPVNVLVVPGAPPVAELASLGVARISVGSHFARVSTAALAVAGRELIESGTYGWLPQSARGAELARRVFA
jgi:2-methylisocitrate lyase-like PEP mutase family enzyme